MLLRLTHELRETSQELACFDPIEEAVVSVANQVLTMDEVELPSD